MLKTPEPTSRLVILNYHPQVYKPKARDLLVSEPMTSQEALEIGKMAAEKHPSGIAGFAFIEDVNAPATVKLICDTCDTRRQPKSIDYIRYLLGLE